MSYRVKGKKRRVWTKDEKIAHMRAGLSRSYELWEAKRQENQKLREEIAGLKATCSWTFVFGKKEGAVWTTKASSHLLSWGMAKQMADQLGEVILGHIAWFADDSGKGDTNPDLHPEEKKQVELMLGRLAEARGYDTTG
jgi:hypothetical protein